MQDEEMERTKEGKQVSLNNKYPKDSLSGIPNFKSIHWYEGPMTAPCELKGLHCAILWLK